MRARIYSSLTASDTTEEHPWRARCGVRQSKELRKISIIIIIIQSRFFLLCTSCAFFHQENENTTFTRRLTAFLFFFICINKILCIPRFELSITKLKKNIKKKKKQNTAWVSTSDSNSEQSARVWIVIVRSQEAVNQTLSPALRLKLRLLHPL